MWAARMQREMADLTRAPPPGISCFPVDGTSLNHLEAHVSGPPGTVYAGGVFKLDVRIPDRYPLEPPLVRFVTPVYHPNIDSGGRICLDILNVKAKGPDQSSWAPSQNMRTVLLSIGLLLECPNPDDGLMTDITHEFKHSRALFDQKAAEMTRKHAMDAVQAAGGAEQAQPEDTRGGAAAPPGEHPAAPGAAPAQVHDTGASAAAAEHAGGSTEKGTEALSPPAKRQKPEMPHLAAPDGA